jgi:hypothetical protein
LQQGNRQLGHHSAAADFVSGERARLSGTDPSAAGVGGVMPLNIPSPTADGIDPGTGVGAQFPEAGWGTARSASIYGPLGKVPASTATATAPRRSARLQERHRVPQCRGPCVGRTVHDVADLILRPAAAGVALESSAR